MKQNISQNYFKPDEYKFYHLCILNDEDVIFDSYDLSFDNVKTKIDKIINRYNFIVIGTIEKIDLCINYINVNAFKNGLFVQLNKKDIFKSPNSIFVNCTHYFKNLYNNV